MNFHDDFEWISSATISDATTTVYFVVLCIYLLNAKWFQSKCVRVDEYQFPCCCFFLLTSFRQIHINVANERKKSAHWTTNNVPTKFMMNFFIWLSDLCEFGVSKWLFLLWLLWYCGFCCLLISFCCHADDGIHVKCSNIVFGNFVLYAYYTEKKIYD